MQILQLSKESEPLPQLFDLFDQYRQFYRQSSDPIAAREFIAERLSNNESVIFIALEGAEALGFVQLYPSFSSVAMRRAFILNDLYVQASARSRGVAQALMRHSEQFARDQGAHHLVLETEISNTQAQSLYEYLGWKKDDEHIHYGRILD